MPKSLSIMKYLILAGLFLSPFLVFIVSSSMFFPFITGKNFSFRILVEVITGLWLALVLFDPKYRPKKSWVLFMLAAFVVVLALSSVFGENFYRSFWSNYERMEGLVTYLHLFAFFIVLASMFKTERIWKWFFNTMLLASALIGVYGVLQLTGVWKTHQGNRLDATLGNATYLAIYAVFHIFLAAILYLRNKDLSRWFYGALIILESFVLYYTATRGAILGLIGGVAIAAMLIVLFSKGKKIRLASGAILLILITIIGGFWFLKSSDFVKKSEVLSRFANISATETTTESRLTIWKMSWEGFKAKPLFGWGPENYNLVFNKYYKPILYKQEPWFDRAHNVFFDRLTTNGLFGLLTYLGLVGVAIYYLWVRRKDEHLSVGDSALFTGMFLAYFFHNIFVFDNIISWILFVTFLAYVHFRATATSVAVAVKPPANPTMVKGANFNYSRASFAVVLGGVFLFIIYFVNIPGIMASKTIIRAFMSSGQGDVKGAFENFQKAIAYNSFGSMEAREHLSNFAMQVYSQPALDAEFKNKVMDYAIVELKKQNEQYPNDIREMIFLASVYNKAKKYDDAIELLNKAIKISPNKQQLYFELGSAYLSKADYQNGLETLKKSFDLAPEYLEAREIYAVAAIFAGKETLAEEIMKDFGGTIIGDERFLKAYAQKNDVNKVVAILKILIDQNPSNIQYRLNLASVYLQANKRTLSVEQIQKAIEINPEFKKQGEYYINEIKAGRNP